MGRPRTPLPPLRDGLALTSITPEELDDLDREVVGFTRRVDHEAWQRWERLPFALRDGLTLVGYGYAQPAGRIGPAVVREAGDLLPLIGALMGEVEAAEDWMVHVPGVAAEPFAALLQAGMKFDGPPIIYCAPSRASTTRATCPPRSPCPEARREGTLRDRIPSFDLD